MPRSIALIGPTHPYKGGIAHATESLAHAFLESGKQVHVYNFSSQYPSWLIGGRSQIDLNRPNPLRDGCAYRILSTLNPFSWIRTARAIAVTKPDYVLLQYWHPWFVPCFFVISLFLRLCSIPVFLIVHNAQPHERVLLSALFFRQLAQNCSGCITLSEFVADQLKSMGKSRPVLPLFHPVYDQFHRNVTTSLTLPKRPVFLFFGAIREYKGLDLLLEALAKPALQQQEWHLLIAGEAFSETESYQQSLHHLQLSDRVTWHNHYIPDCDVATYFQAADLVVQPYRSATQSGVSQIAMAFGVPSLVTRVGGLSESITPETGIVVSPTVDAIAHGITEFLRSPDQFQNEHKETVDYKHTWQHFVDQVDQWIVSSFLPK